MLVHDQIATSLSARFLASELEKALSLQTEERASVAAARLGKEYDQAPVRDDAGVIGYVLTHELMAAPRRLVKTVMHPLSKAVVVDGASPIRDVLPILRDHRFAFMVENQIVLGFIVPSDLNKQAGRAYFYLLIAALEVGLAELIRDNSNLAEQEKWLGHLSRDGRFAVECRFLADQKMHVDVDYVAYMDFTHLVRIVGDVPKLRSLVGIVSTQRWEELTGGLPQLRNDVMHSTREFLSPDRTVADLMRHEEAIATLLRPLHGIADN